MIATIFAMPILHVYFAIVREIIFEFLHDVGRIGFSEISPCPFGQAYVRINSVLDREYLVNHSPHQYGDVHIIFQKHNQGLIKLEKSYLQ